MIRRASNRPLIVLRRRNGKEKNMSKENIKEIEGQELDAGVEPTAEDIAEAEKEE